MDPSEYFDRIILGNAVEVLRKLPDNLVDTIMTSPPYYGQRYYPGAETVYDGQENCEHDWETYIRPSNCWSTPGQGIYGTKGEYNKAWVKAHEQAFCRKCGAWRGQLGQEPDPEQYINHLLQIFRECYRILKPSGVFFLNIGDAYWSSLGLKTNSKWVRPKQLLMVPYRLASRMQEEGWLLRNIIIWRKTCPVPHPVKDRLTNTYEPVFLFTKSPKYYFDLDSIREPHRLSKTGETVPGYHPLGKNPGDVWEIKTAQYPGAHTAVFPEELVEKCLLAGCPKEVCSRCGKPKVRKYRIVERRFEDLTEEEKEYLHKVFSITRDGKQIVRKKDSPEDRAFREKCLKALLKKKEFIGLEPSCKCGSGFRPGVVLDPFIGSGTTAVVAKSLGLHFIGIDISPKYVKMAEDRLRSTIGGYV